MSSGQGIRLCRWLENKKLMPVRPVPRTAVPVGGIMPSRCGRRPRHNALPAGIRLCRWQKNKKLTSVRLVPTIKNPPHKRRIFHLDIKEHLSLFVSDGVHPILFLCFVTTPVVMPVLKKHSFERKSFLSFFQNNDKLWRNYGLNCGELWQRRKK